MVTYLVVTLISHGHITTITITTIMVIVIMDGTFLHQKLSYFHSKTTTDMDILKGTLAFIETQCTIILIMVRHSAEDMIFTLQTMQIVTIILTLILTLIPVNTLTMISGQEITISAQMR